LVIDYSIAVAPSGSVLVGYEMTGGIFSTAYSAGMWAPPRSVASQVMGALLHPIVATAGDSRAIFVSQGDALAASLGAADGSDWSPPFQMATSTILAQGRLVAGFSDGSAWMTWRPRETSDVLASELDASGTWSPPTHLGVASIEPGTSPVIATDRASSAVVAWTNSDAMVARWDARTSEWSEPADLGPAGINGDGPDVAFDGPGLPLVAFWTPDETPPSKIELARWNETAERWNVSTVATIAADTYVIGYDGVRVVANGRGDVAIAWKIYHRENPLDTRGELWATVFRDGSWDTPQLLGDGDVDSLDLAMTADGDVVVAWIAAKGGWHASARRNQRRLRAWSDTHLLDPMDASDVRIGVDTSGVATAIWGDGGSLYAAREVCE
jgi:hypothetical protein